MMKFKSTYLSLLVFLVFFSFSSEEKKEAELGQSVCLTKETNYIVGDTIILKFASEANNRPYLYCFSAYGSTLIEPKVKKNTLEYIFPESITRKRGVVNWILQNKEESLKGHFEISPLQEAKDIETYIGPPSMEVGEENFTMYVTIPTDRYDNPVIKDTEVKVSHQYQDYEDEVSIYTDNLMAFEIIYSKLKKGRVLIGSECFGLHSKESTVNVLPYFPDRFEIFETRHHAYADGNQIVEFSTSRIKDQYDNIVSDGTYVEFIVTTQKGAILKTFGTTINGIATAKLIHPDHESQWQVKAVVDRMAVSNELSMAFTSVIEDFEVSFSENNRTVTVGPIKSFMKQLIPDGFEVELKVIKDGEIIKTALENSIDGFVEFQLKHDIFKIGRYTIEIKMADKKKEFKSMMLW